MKKILFIILLVPLFSFTIHKYYIALTEIEFKEESKSVQIIMNVFIDDIEEALNKDYTIDTQISYKEELKNIDVYFEKYLNEHFQISINSEQKKYLFIGKEYEGNVVYFYLEIKDVLQVKTMKIKNNMLLDYFPKQQNIIKVKNNKKKESLFLTQKKQKALLKF